MQHRGDRTPQLERLARLADGSRAVPEPADVAHGTAGGAERVSLRQRSRGMAGRLAPFASGVLAVLVALALYGALTPRVTPMTTADVDERVASVLSSQVPGLPFSALAFDVIAPSLVLIRTGADDPVRGVDGGRAELGSGVLVSEEGVILTALHVIRGADRIDLTFADGATTAASVLEERPERDVALLVADELPESAVPAVLGNPGLPVGSEAFAVGSPYGLFGSLSAGVISGRERSFRLPDSTITVTGLLQFDAAVNPGNSGGPLLDRAGRVIGIVIALLNPTDDDTFAGIGLAVPIDAAAGGGGMPAY
jgi:S1-C subfamily serine protease